MSERFVTDGHLRLSGRYDAEPARGQGLTVQTGPWRRGLRRRARSSSC